MRILERGWKHSRLGDYFKIKHGFAFKGDFFADDGQFILLTPGNFRTDGGIKLKGDREKYYAGEFPDEYLLRRGEMLVVMTDLKQSAPILGSPAITPEDGRFLHNQRLGKIVELDESRMGKGFLYYLFNSYSVRSQIKATATGATVRHTAPDRIYAVEVYVPPLPTQRKIAAILSAYDDLIENNTRRIAILEQMAQLLYREWFVHFRFPGHEDVEMVDSALGPIPKGWETKQLGDVIELAYGKGLRKKDRIPGPYPVYGSSGVIDQHNEPLVEGPGIIVGRKGNVGNVFWSDEGFYPIDTVFYVQTEVNLHYVYYNLQRQHFLSTNTAVPGLNRNQAYLLPFLLPSDKIMRRFQDFVAPIFQQIRNLQLKSDVLRRTRDLLLPRLISGGVDVSRLGIDTEGVER
jgi:type I restriction enzyme S subunit